MLSAFRRTDELTYLIVAAVAMGLIGSLAGAFAVYLVALAESQLAAYIFILRDWDRGLLEGLVYYVGHMGVYISRLVLTALFSAMASALAAVLVSPSYVLLAVLAAILTSSSSALAAMLTAYGGLSAPAGAAMSAVLSLPPLLHMAETGAGAPAAYVICFVVAIGLLASEMLDRP
ncbi:MAG: hypothetical protein QXK62_05485 [Thermoproteus sp.]